jgi:hypothetical protein
MIIETLIANGSINTGITIPHGLGLGRLNQGNSVSGPSGEANGDY